MLVERFAAGGAFAVVAAAVVGGGAGFVVTAGSMSWLAQPARTEKRVRVVRDRFSKSDTPV
jgi:hypothetical protein